MIRKFVIPFAFGLVLSAGAHVCMAQHETGTGGSSGAASGGGTTSSASSSRNTVRRTPPRRTPPARTTPARRGITAEQYLAQADELFKAKNYDEALDAYQHSVALKPNARAYYQIGWIYN